MSRTETAEAPAPAWHSLALYELTEHKLDNAFDKLVKMRQKREPEPIIVPLGHKWDAAHYLLYRYKSDRKNTPKELKIYQVSFARRAGRRLAACDCWAGTKEVGCYHVAACYGVHLTYAALAAGGLLLVPSLELPMPARVAALVESFAAAE